MNDNFTSGLSESNSLYNEALSYLYGRLPMFSRVGGPAYKPGLETSLRLAGAFGNPQRKFKSVHIAGTNGKGSTSHNLASIFQAAGYKTGLYTSPHLVDFRERIRIDGQMIPRDRVIDFTERWKALSYQGEPSFFELTMMMAFEWFAEQKVDIAVIEVGMGGRLDSTNIILPELCVITNISKDHTQFLGTTSAEIAAEKAGIIKRGIPVVIGEAEGEVRKVFERKAEENDAPVIFAEQSDVWALPPEETDEGGWHGFSPLAGGEWQSPLGGDYQVRNLRTVLTAVKAINSSTGFRLPQDAVRDGLRDVVRSTGLAGRWTVTGRTPLTICDTGHNEAGLAYNLGQLRRLLARRPGARLHMVMGFVADKAIDDILAIMPADARYHLTQASIPRALPVEILYEKCRASGLDCSTPVAEVSQAVKSAMAEATPEDIVYIGGSTFVVADYLATNPKS